MVVPPPSSAATCAAESTPRASPETMVMPAETSCPARCPAAFSAYGEARREPTMAMDGLAASERSPRKKRAGGGSTICCSSGGYSGSARVTAVGRSASTCRRMSSFRNGATISSAVAASILNNPASSLADALQMSANDSKVSMSSRIRAGVTAGRSAYAISRSRRDTLVMALTGASRRERLCGRRAGNDNLAGRGEQR